MKKFSIKELAKIIAAKEPNIQQSVTGISIDSRTTKAGDCFFAIKGAHFDGSDYVNDAFAKGAVCAVVNMDSCLGSTLLTTGRRNDNTKHTIILTVDDTTKALGLLAKEYRKICGFKVVAITGSVGKTTTRQIAYHILSKHFKCCQSPKNFNNEIGLPLTLLAAKPNDEIIIAELGSNNPGEIDYLTKIAQPNIAVVTNVYAAHLTGFGNLQTIKKEKSSIANGLQKDGVLIINANIKTNIANRIVTFGKSDKCDVKAENICLDGLQSRFTIDGVQIKLPLAGIGNIENTLAAFAVCRELGIKINDFAKEIKTLPVISMRAEPMQIGKLTVINDCYNANPASMKNAIEILSELGSKKKRRTVFICGEMAELGGQTNFLHSELGKAIAEAKIRLLLAVGKSAEITADSAKKNAEYDLQTKCFEDTILVCSELENFIKDDDVVLVKGSRTAKLEIVIEKLKEIFS
ncbi:MAG: UDP-N-acetylmuramoyl-tripeptide--D-alanyl-D-alanine ligase [Planctomycetes bacterium]|nr:UDP-N-acetylmuramoyl-tripeptide--D-alanyl-D-alanine ligase [Planctomycetota bacterium]